MIGGDNIVGLLHLVATALLLALGYIGLDRVRQNPQTFWNELQAAQDIALRLLSSKLDITPSSERTKLVPWCDSFEVHVLVFVAAIKVRIGCFRRLFYFVCRQAYLPMFGYYRNRHDRRVVGGFAIILAITFLLLCASTLWEISMLAEIQILRGVYIYTVIMMLWILGTVACSYPLNAIRLQEVCEKLADRAAVRVNDLIPAMDQTVRSTEKRLSEHQVPAPAGEEPAADRGLP
jgi:hypothetical protein